MLTTDPRWLAVNWFLSKYLNLFWHLQNYFDLAKFKLFNFGPSIKVNCATNGLKLALLLFSTTLNQWEDQAKELILPSLDPSLARLGTITASPDGDLRVNIILGTGAHPDRESWNLSLQKSLSVLPWTRNIQVKVSFIVSKIKIVYSCIFMLWRLRCMTLVFSTFVPFVAVPVSKAKIST